jgi:hypothetical protein
MIDLSSIYHNPIVPEGYYYVQVVHLETDDVPGCKKPRILLNWNPGGNMIWIAIFAFPLLCIPQKRLDSITRILKIPFSRAPTNRWNRHFIAGDACRSSPVDTTRRSIPR